DAAGILNRACKNCHSNQTVLPWYAKLAPMSWLVNDDVRRARIAMNLSDWPEKPRLGMAALAASCSAMHTRPMPPPPYRWLHPEANLSNEDAVAFCGWTEKESLILRDQIHESRKIRILSAAYR